MKPFVLAPLRLRALGKMNASSDYSARWITLCEERRRTKGYMLDSRLTEQLTDCGNLNIPTEARPIPVVVLGLGR
jgi:hypothetical protein